MNLAFGILFLFAGTGALYVASHGLEASTPWGAFQTVINKIGEA